MTDPSASVRDQIIAASNNLPDLIQRASALDPTLAAALTGQATVASKTPLGAFAAAGIAWAAAHFGLGWGQAFDDTLAGLGIVAGGYITHWVQARVTASRMANAPAASVTPPTAVTP